MTRIGLLGSKGSTLDFLVNFRAVTGFEISHLALLPSDNKAASKVSYHMADRLLDAATAQTVHLARSYGLTDPEDQAFFEQAKLDILFVVGWERLVPDAILGTLRCGAYGMHGSSYGLPRGRGRSPMNWAILQGHNHFTTSLFRYTPGVDDGDVVASQTFTIFPEDDIAALHTKNRVSMLRLASHSIAGILAGTIVHQPQSTEAATFYPKRVPEDGGIDWSRSSQEIIRLVRAVAPPYPGAFTAIGQRILRIAACQEFERSLFSSSIADGTIVDVSPSTGNFVVKTADGSVLVTSWGMDEPIELQLGTVLQSLARHWSLDELSSRYGPIPLNAWEIQPEP